MNKLPIELSVDLISQPNTDGLTGEEQSPIRQSVTIPVLMIEDTASLDAIAKIWLDAAVLAIDTEFERRTTFFAKLALVQIFDGQSIYLIDPLKVDCPLSLKEVFSSTKIIKVLHSSKEDLEVLFTAWNCKLRGLFDTQIAYHMIHDEVSIGYAKLVETFTGIAISKQQTQSDWTIRPLSTAQLEYAANDVVYLIEIYRLLECNLVEKNHAHLYREECDEICEQSIRRVENLADYRDAKEVWLLSELELSLFKVMFDWREKLARTENRTRNHIIKDQELVSLVKIKPNSIGQLKAVESIHPRSIRLYGELWLDLVQNWKAK
ncbi:MAG: HRDC domain-containing protein, partial [Kangiellaceae bacterium]|nr:HRDC domain-containing protein [Kangiellaceae bacterium]